MSTRELARYNFLLGEVYLSSDEGRELALLHRLYQAETPRFQRAAA